MYFSFSSWAVGLTLGVLLFVIFGVGLCGGLWWTRRLELPRWATAANIFWGSFLVAYAGPALELLGLYTFKTQPLVGGLLVIVGAVTWFLGIGLVALGARLAGRESAARKLAHYSAVHHAVAGLVFSLLWVFVDEARSVYFAGMVGGALGAILGLWLRARLQAEAT